MFQIRGTKRKITLIQEKETINFTKNTGNNYKGYQGTNYKNFKPQNYHVKESEPYNDFNKNIA